MIDYEYGNDDATTDQNQAFSNLKSRQLQHQFSNPNRKTSTKQKQTLYVTVRNSKNSGSHSRRRDGSNNGQGIRSQVRKTGRNVEEDDEEAQLAYLNGGQHLMANWGGQYSEHRDQIDPELANGMHF